MYKVETWGEAMALLLDGGVDGVEFLGRIHSRMDALVSLGYDLAESRGLLDEYKNVWGIA